MREFRSWEEMKRDNVGAAWIKNGEFCTDYRRMFTGEKPTRNDNKLPDWKRAGFNGCWSCNNMLSCTEK